MIQQCHGQNKKPPTILRSIAATHSKDCSDKSTCVEHFFSVEFYIRWNFSSQECFINETRGLEICEIDLWVRKWERGRQKDRDSKNGQIQGCRAKIRVVTVAGGRGYRKNLLSLSQTLKTGSWKENLGGQDKHSTESWSSLWGHYAGKHLAGVVEMFPPHALLHLCSATFRYIFVNVIHFSIK